MGLLLRASFDAGGVKRRFDMPFISESLVC